MLIKNLQWEGRQSAAAAAYPLQLITTNPAYTFHTYGDGKNGTINDIADHRVLVGGRYYWVLRMMPADAAARGLKQHDLVKVHNERGAVICAVDISPLMASGVVKAYESCASTPRSRRRKARSTAAAA